MSRFRGIQSHVIWCALSRDARDDGDRKLEVQSAMLEVLILT